jgi:hypothetical protein
MADKKGSKKPTMVGNQNALGNEGGRPTDYLPEYCDQLIEYFEIEPNREVEIPHLKDGEVVWIDYKIVANRLPVFHEFAKKIGVTHKTLLNWCDSHVEFLQSYTQAKELQKFFLIENGLSNCYNANFAIFTAKNITDMRDRQEITGADGKDLIPARTLSKIEAASYILKLENEL